MATNFFIVEFSGSHPREVEIVHQCWLKDNHKSTFWPGFCGSREELRKLLIRGSLPDSSWDIYDINRILSTAGNYSDAKRKLVLAEDTSDLTSDNEKIQRRIKPRKRLLSESSTESEEEVSQSLVSKYKSPLIMLENHKKMTKPFSTSTPLLTKKTSTPLSSKGKYNNENNLQKKICQKLSKVTNSYPGMSNEEHSLVLDVGNYESSKENSYTEQSAQKRIPKQSISKVTNYPHHETFDNSLILDTAECVSFPDKSKDLETKFDVLQEYIIKREEKILTLLEENNSMIRSLVSYCKPIQENLPLNVKMPFNNVLQIEENEEYLKDEANLTSTVNYLSLYNGSSASESTRRIMRKVLTKELSSEYNWIGRGDKKPFKNLLLKNAIISAILKDNVTTIKDIENCMKSWLKNQGQRIISENTRGTLTQK